MATERQRSYFFDVPSGNSYKRFKSENIPDEKAYRDLFESLAFKLEEDDTASESQQGLVKLATDNQARDRDIVSGMQISVRPHQLPLLMLGSTEADTADTAVADDGIKVTPKEVTDGSNTRFSFKVELDPNSLDTATPDSSSDYLVFEDASDSNLPKKALITDFFDVATYWDRTGTVLSPATADDSLDMGDAQIGCGPILLDAAANRTIKLDDGSGKSLTIGGATDSAAGGFLELLGNDGSAGAGGAIYITGGDGSTTDGDVIINYTSDGVKRGKTGIGGSADSTFQIKVYGGIYVPSGGMRIDGLASGTIGSMVAIDGDNDLIVGDADAVNEYLFGSASQGDILYFDGSSWQLLSSPGATDKVLTFDYGVTDIPKWDDLPSSTDSKVAIDSGATAGYLGAAKTDGVLRITTYGGLGYTDGGDYISLFMDIDDLQETTDPVYGSYIAITDSNGDTKKWEVVDPYKKNSGWIQLTAGTDYTADADTQAKIITSDLTSLFEAGQPIKFKLNGVSGYRYAIIDEIASGYIIIKGDPMGTGSPGTLDELYIGPKSKVFTKTYPINVANYNSADSTGVLEDKMNFKEGDKWSGGTAKVVKLEAIHKSDDSTTQPYINARVGAPGSTTDYICTSNSNSGFSVGTSWADSDINVEASKNTIEYGDNIEIKVEKNGTGDADYLTAILTFINL